MWTQMGSKTDGYTKTYTDLVEEKGRKEKWALYLSFFLGLAHE